MQLSGRPLLDIEADQALFVGRSDVLGEIDRSLRAGLNCLLAGEPGSGKTSVVRALMFAHRAGPIHFSYVRAAEARTAGDLLAAALDAVRDARRESDRADPGEGALELLADLTELMAQAQDADPGRRVVVVEDVSAAAGTELFGALRDEVWQVAAVWLVTTSTAQLPGLLRPPADVFFETRVQLGPLDEAQAAELLYRRMDEPLPPDQTALVAAVSGSAPQTPRRLLDLARELAAAPAVGAGRLTMASGLGQRSAAVQRLSRPGRMLAQELDAVGWAAASDRTLLARLGWTRPRVVQVMAELENGGLVEMREENTGRGRPRKLYRLKPPRDFAPPIVAPDEPDRPADGDGSGPRVAGAGGRGGPEPGAAGSAGSAGPTGGADLQTGAEPR